MIKTGRDQQLPKVDPDDVNSAVYWGNVLETHCRTAIFSDDRQ